MFKSTQSGKARAHRRRRLRHRTRYLRMSKRLRRRRLLWRIVPPEVLKVRKAIAELLSVASPKDQKPRSMTGEERR